MHGREDGHEKKFYTYLVAAFLPSPLPRMQQAELQLDVLKRLENCVCVIKLYFQISTLAYNPLYTCILLALSCALPCQLSVPNIFPR